MPAAARRSTLAAQSRARTDAPRRLSRRAPYAPPELNYLAVLDPLRGLEGASRFPRHWIYDEDGRRSHNSGLADFRDWYRKSFGRHTPWGERDSKALVTAVETALEKQLSEQIMQGKAKPTIRRMKAGTTLVRQGELGSEVFLVLEGVLRVEHDGERLAEYGPGALLGERAHLEGGRRTSTLVAVTPCRVASIEAQKLERTALSELSKDHRRETARRKAPARG